MFCINYSLCACVRRVTCQKLVNSKAQMTHDLYYATVTTLNDTCDEQYRNVNSMTRARECEHLSVWLW